MALNHEEWRRFSDLRKVVGDSNRQDRWSLTTAFTDGKGRDWTFAAKHGGDYPGGLSEPFVFQSLDSLEAFIKEVPDWARGVLSKQVGMLKNDPTACHPVKTLAPRPQRRLIRPATTTASAGAGPPMGAGNLDQVLAIAKTQGAVRNADLRAVGWDGVQARAALQEAVKQGKLIQQGSRGATRYVPAAA